MPAKLDRCVEELIKEGKTEEQAYAICNASIKDSAPKHISFTDKIAYDTDSKKCISVRDGVQEYYGAEIGLEPSNKIFTVYRSPETIKDASAKMEGLPLTIGHVSLDTPPIPSGSVITSSIIDLLDNTTSTTVAVENMLKLNDEMKQIEHKEFSLGYYADIVPHSGEFDYEQIGIIPHHLALVEAGRCGSVCSFSDSNKIQNKEDSEMKIFHDEDGQLNMQQIVEAVAALPEIIKSVPLDKLQEIMPAVNELVMAAKEAGMEIDMPEEEMTEPEEPAMDEEMSEEEEKKPMEDSAKFKDALQKGIMDAVVRHGEVVDKAKTFLDDTYSFAGKKTCQVMRDALATQYGKQEFSDAELGTAFKMLQKVVDHSMADKAINGLDSLKDKEL